ncbi:MAG: hypothetical protein H6737_14675 [Alphaproteobacteria bacterium]|nr:hypothetical protein [Alphaproteobacteria bacterium]
MTEQEARDAVARARDLMERVVGGMFGSEAREAAAVEESRTLYDAAIEVFRQAGLEPELAEALADRGFLALHGANAPQVALPLLLEAAERYEALGDARARLATLLDLAPIDPVHPALDAVYDAVAAGLPGDLEPEEDPLVLVVARRVAGHHDAALALAQALVDEALARGDRARAAKMLGERGKTEQAAKQRKAAMASFEQALALAEEARDAEETLRSLLLLVDACWSSGDQKRARELFARAEKVRGVPQSLRTLRKITAMALK